MRIQIWIHHNFRIQIWVHQIFGFRYGYIKYSDSNMGTYGTHLKNLAINTNAGHSSSVAYAPLTSRQKFRGSGESNYSHTKKKMACRTCKFFSLKITLVQT